VRGRIHRVVVVEGGLVVGVVSALDLLQLIGEPN
jgi:signal-transduction protein with cAMP-binding, CBS, and nucleotidyltransferase domain